MGSKVDMLNPFFVDNPYIWKGNFEFKNIGKIKFLLESFRDKIKVDSNSLESGNAFSTVFYDDFRPHKSIYFSDFYNQLFNDLKFIHYGFKKTNISKDYKLNEVYETGFSSIEYLQTDEEFCKKTLTNEYFKNKFLIDNSWCNIHYSTGHTLEHSHGNTDYVCSYYLQVPKDSGNLLVKPKYSNEWVSIPVASSDYLIFPGWLLHKTEVSDSSDVRIVATTNIFSVD